MTFTVKSDDFERGVWQELFYAQNEIPLPQDVWIPGLTCEATQAQIESAIESCTGKQESIRNGELGEPDPGEHYTDEEWIAQLESAKGILSGYLAGQLGDEDPDFATMTRAEANDWASIDGIGAMEMVRRQYVVDSTDDDRFKAEDAAPRPSLHLRTANQIAAGLRLFEKARREGQCFEDDEHFEETTEFTDEEIEKLCNQLYHLVNYLGKDEGPDLFDRLLEGVEVDDGQ